MDDEETAEAEDEGVEAFLLETPPPPTLFLSALSTSSAISFTEKC